MQRKVRLLRDPIVLAAIASLGLALLLTDSHAARQLFKANLNAGQGQWS
ncbi:MAG: hypothetical protein ABFD97_14745 [Syntrophobacter sp.]